MVDKEFAEDWPCIGLEVVVRSGKGMGRNFVDSLKSNDPIISMLGATPYPGTLFVQLKKPIKPRGYSYLIANGQEAKILVGDFDGIKVVIKWSKTYPKNLHLISNLNLRSALHLIDGQISKILVSKDDISRNSVEIYWYVLLQWLKTTQLAKLRRKLLSKCKIKPLI